MSCKCLCRLPGSAGCPAFCRGPLMHSKSRLQCRSFEAQVSNRPMCSHAACPYAGNVVTPLPSREVNATRDAPYQSLPSTCAPSACVALFFHECAVFLHCLYVLAVYGSQSSAAIDKNRSHRTVAADLSALVGAQELFPFFHFFLQTGRWSAEMQCPYVLAVSKVRFPLPSHDG
jgi:hypothetical protein